MYIRAKPDAEPAAVRVIPNERKSHDSRHLQTGFMSHSKENTRFFCHGSWHFIFFSILTTICANIVKCQVCDKYHDLRKCYVFLITIRDIFLFVRIVPHARLKKHRQRMAVPAPTCPQFSVGYLVSSWVFFLCLLTRGGRGEEKINAALIGWSVLKSSMGAPCIAFCRRCWRLSVPSLLSAL